MHEIGIALKVFADVYLLP